MDVGGSESIKEPTTYFKSRMKNKGYLNRHDIKLYVYPEAMSYEDRHKIHTFGFCFRRQKKLAVWYS